MVAINYLWNNIFRLMQRRVSTPLRRICFWEILMTLFFCGAILFSLTGCRREVLDDNDDGDNVNVIQNHLTIDIAVLDLTGWLGVSASEQGSVQHMITAMGPFPI